MTQIKKIGLFTSGSDAPGMNAAIRAVIRTAVFNNIEIAGILRGFEGMINGDIEPLTTKSASNIISRGGTILKASRSEAFKTVEGRTKAYEEIKKHGIDALVALGGNGTIKGVKDFGDEHPDIKIIVVPCTIDNDLRGTDFTIGYDTAINTVIEAVDKIRETAESHDRLFIVEVMGADSGMIALRTGIAVGAEAIMVPETKSDLNALYERLERGRKDKTSKIIMVAEGHEPGSAFQIGEAIKERYPNYDTRVSILGHIQRGGKPTCMDRVTASLLGVAAVEALIKGRSGVMVGLIHNDLTYTPFDQATKHHLDVNAEFKRIVEMLSL
ncbi:6-phosphofructokinase [Mucilaginibacter antarcticus]|uniref:ATP-dependent 6-phosphofructokinase n=1 Tax=Mucilaginibacter antarcticus TaxID=1855725 RepID=A0ABW5XMU3_9SPHI